MFIHEDDMDLAEFYAYHRAWALQSAINSRTRITLFDCKASVVALRDAQKYMWALRYYRRTGVEPGWA